MQIHRLYSGGPEDEEQCGGCLGMASTFYSLAGPVTVEQQGEPDEDGDYVDRPEINGMCAYCLMDWLNSEGAGVVFRAFEGKPDDQETMEVQEVTDDGN